ncbi:MAG: hypothetical protein RBS07_17835 [Lentimicrobium sp.]|jgi:uncharacterized protein YoxC|nr:hypothetical protein [Lentimicrobium sp.]
MNALALFFGAAYGVIALAFLFIIIYLIIKRRKKKSLEDFEKRDN